MSSPLNFWEDLFAAGQGAILPVEMRLLRKRGRPFLLLPMASRAAAESLQLYPAQTGRARVAKALLHWSLGASLPWGTERVSFAVAGDDLFVRFLMSLSGENSFPALGILAGNPASDGQRFLLLVFDADGQPVAVVKAGLSERARALIGREETLLRALDGKISGIPNIRDACETPRLRAMALDFFSGDSPRRQHDSAVPPLLCSWVDRKRHIALRDTADWARLETAAAGHAFFEKVRELRDWPLHPVIQHGDFAPWNIKVSPAGEWTVIDWERGELVGIPGWDWFHYVIQPAILVERLGPAYVAQRAEQLLNSAPFREYALLSGAKGCERELVLAYLLHAAEVIKPSEGLTATRELFATLSSRWAIA